MPSMTIPILTTVRAEYARLHNMSVLANITEGNADPLSGGDVQRPYINQINVPDWMRGANGGLNGHFKRHNQFRLQEMHDRVGRGWVNRTGTLVKYFVTSYNPTGPYKEDTARQVERTFDTAIVVKPPPDLELFNRFGIEAQDEVEIHIHRRLFFEHNYASLKREGVQPACPENEHNPVYHQRGSTLFKYYGYSAEQMLPKSGDYIHLAHTNTLYYISSVKIADPNTQHRWREYWFRVWIRPALNDGTVVSNGLDTTAEDKSFLSQILGTQEADGNTTPPAQHVPFDITCELQGLKEPVIFHPEAVDPEVKDVTCDPKFYACPDLFGQW